MTTDLIAELAEVVRHVAAARSSEAEIIANQEAAEYLTTHHAALTRIITSEAELRAAHDALVIRLGEVTVELERARKDAERWRHARKILPVEYITDAQHEYEAYGLEGSEQENIAADQAIDQAMHDSAREG